MAAAKPVSPPEYIDCKFYYSDSGTCWYGDNCYHRHCPQARGTTITCSAWRNGYSCREKDCKFRHPLPGSHRESQLQKPAVIVAPLPPPMHHLSVAAPVFNPVPPPPRPEPSRSAPLPRPQREGFVSFYWDIENCQIPRGQRALDVVKQLRAELLAKPRLRELEFNCYVKHETLTPEIERGLYDANVKLILVPDTKPGGIDRAIVRDLNRFQKSQRPPATLVLISGDRDFARELNELRHCDGFYVIAVHNAVATAALIEAVDEHYYLSEITHDPQAVIAAAVQGPPQPQTFQARALYSEAAAAHWPQLPTPTAVPGGTAPSYSRNGHMTAPTSQIRNGGPPPQDTVLEHQNGSCTRHRSASQQTQGRSVVGKWNGNDKGQSQ